LSSVGFKPNVYNVEPLFNVCHTHNKPHDAYMLCVLVWALVEHTA
jgi:hypothetical protein